MDNHRVRLDVKGNQYSPLESHDAQTRPQVVSSCASFRGKFEPGTVSFNSVDIIQSAGQPGLSCDVFVEIEKVGGSFRREDDPRAFSDYVDLSRASWPGLARPSTS